MLETGMRFNKLVALGKVKAPSHIKTQKSRYWLFQCDCGKTKVARDSNVRTGETKSCGCVFKAKTEPLYGTKFYYTFHLIKQRCNNPKHPRYDGWGGRGIKCLWESFQDFKNDMYEAFLQHESTHGGRQTTIDRIDNDGSYCKENCRWATASEQSRNTRATLA